MNLRITTTGRAARFCAKCAARLRKTANTHPVGADLAAEVARGCKARFVPLVPAAGRPYSRVAHFGDSQRVVRLPPPFGFRSRSAGCEYAKCGTRRSQALVPAVSPGYRDPLTGWHGYAARDGCHGWRGSYAPDDHHAPVRAWRASTVMNCLGGTPHTVRMADPTQLAIRSWVGTTHGTRPMRGRGWSTTHATRRRLKPPRQNCVQDRGTRHFPNATVGNIQEATSPAREFC